MLGPTARQSLRGGPSAEVQASAPVLVMRDFLTIAASALKAATPGRSQSPTYIPQSRSVGSDGPIYVRVASMDDQMRYGQNSASGLAARSWACLAQYIARLEAQAPAGWRETEACNLSR